MAKTVSCKKLLAAMAWVLVISFLTAPWAFSQASGPSRTWDHNQRGLEYFNKGFYDHTPRQQAAEAERNYGLAIREFLAAISEDPFHPEAHKNLARLYFLKKNFNHAALMYQRATELDQGDLDAYVNLALALIELKRFDEAVQALSRAKTQTSDPKVLEKLDSYISRILAHQTKEVN